MPKTPRNTLTFEEVNDQLRLDPETGELWWRASRRGVSTKKPAGSPNQTGGYREIAIFGQRFLEHRIVWLLHTGSWPAECVDHINGVKSDNRPANLREASVIQNNRNVGVSRNNKAGFKGVSSNDGRRFFARIVAEGKTYNLGSYGSPEEAHAAYVEASKKLHGEFSRAS